MDNSEKYKLVYIYAKEFLKELVESHPELNDSILKDHLLDTCEFNTLEDAHRRMIESLSNRNMMATVIDFIGKEEKMRKLLFGYNPAKILSAYPAADDLFRKFKDTFEIRNAESKRNLWRKFSEGIISGSKFMSTFSNKEEFDKFVKTFSFNKYTKAALPMLLSKEVDGFGFALACDFLKELGYREYPKPDVHLIKIFSELKLTETATDYEVYKSIVEMSEIVGDDAYTVDKVFWLISSGRFYLNNIEIGRNRDKFISEVKQKLK